MKKRKKVNGKYFSTIRFMPKIEIYTTVGFKKRKRELSLAILNGEDTTDLEKEVERYEKKLNYQWKGTGDTGPR